MGWMPVLVLVVVLAVMRLERVSAYPFGTCGSIMRSSDADANSELSQSEYVAFVRAVSRNTVSTEFYQYPTPLSSAFTSRKTSSSADAGAPVPAENSMDQTLFCRDVYAGLVAALQLTVDNSTCTRSYTLGDYSRDDLLTKDEYPRFLSWLTSSAVSSSTTYDALEVPLPNYFEDFATATASDGTTVGMNVTGSKPGTSTYVNATQLDTLFDFCTVSLVGVTLAADGTDPTPTGGEAPTSAPVAAAPTPTTTATTSAPVVSSGGGGGGSFVPTIDFSDCLSAMAFSDLSRDALLNQAEYVRFLNRLSSDEYVDSTTSNDLDFSALPVVLQDNYDTLAAGGSGINVEGGTERGVDPTAEEAVILQGVCNATDLALQEARNGGGGGGSGSTPAPAPAPGPTATTTSAAPVAGTPAVTAAPVGSVSTPAPTAFMSKDNCIRYMMLSETTRDGYLDQSEYFRFVNLAANRVWISLSFDELQPILKDNYESLATDNGTISVIGYNPNVNATAEQLDHLDYVCARSSTAIQSALSGGGTWPPTSAPAPASTQTVYNGFLISNSIGLKAPGLQEGSATRQAISDAYTVFVASQMNLYATGSSRRALRSRKRTLMRLLQQSGVKLVPNSTSTDSIVDSICPANATGTSCQTVYGSFGVNVPAGTDPAPVLAALTAQTQAALSTDLQKFVDAGVAATPTAQPVKVEGPSPQNRPPVVSRAPTVAPADAPTTDSGGAKGNDPGKTAAAIIGFLLLIGICVGGAIYLHRRGYKVSDAVAWVRDRMSKVPFLAKFMESNKGTSKSKKAAKTVGEKTDQASRDGSTHLEEDGGLDNNGFGTFETVSPGDGKPSFYKSEEERDGSSSVDFMEGGDDSESAGFSVEQSGTPAERASTQQTGKSGVFNAFGLGKKKNTAGLDDSYGSLQNPEAFQENAANDFADYGFDDPIADFENKNSDSMGELFGKTDEFAAGGPKESAWGAGDGNEWDGAWGAGNAGEAPRSKVDDEDDDDDDDSGFDSETSGSRFERKTKGDRGPTVEAPENLVHLDSMVEQGNWDGVMAAQTKFDTGFELDEGSNPSRPSLEESEGLSESRSSADEYDDEAAPAGDESVNDSHYSLTSAEQTRREQFRQQVENLVRKVVPDEIDNVSAMMDQFAGREAELINTLQNMKERTTVQRARKAIHKSKGVPQRENPAFATGGTDGSAAIAAASTLGVRAGDYGDEEGEYDDEDGEADDYYDDDEGDEGQSYDEEYDDAPRDDEEGSQYSGSQSYDDEGEEGGSQYSGSQGRSQDDNDGGSYYDDEDDRSGSGSGSYSGSGSGSRGRSQDGGSYDDGEPSGSYDDDDDGGDQEGSYDDEDGQEGSYYSGDEDPEGSQHSGSRSGSGSRSYDDGDDQDHDASYTDDQGSYDDDENEPGEGSYRSGDDEEGGSRDDDDDDPDRSHSGSRSYDYDDEGAEQDGSYYSEEGSGGDSRRRDDEDGSGSGSGSVDYGYE